MVCFEGAENKMYFGKHQFGPFMLPNYYHPQHKLISVHAPKRRIREEWIRLTTLVIHLAYSMVQSVKKITV